MYLTVHILTKLGLKGKDSGVCQILFLNGCIYENTLNYLFMDWL